MGRQILAGGVLLFALISHSMASDFTLQSRRTRATVIELYTSEGCNSCPPAERYLNQFRENPKLWQTYIPLAFHVDYWDYLGWKDKFARAAHGTRQHLYARLQRARTVYTPAFFVNGQNWRTGFFSNSVPQASEKAGRLILKKQADSLQASFFPASSDSNNLVLNVALLGMQLTTQINAGENKGRHATHHFVVLSHGQYAGSHNKWRARWPATAIQKFRAETPRFALAAWLSKKEDPTPIQAVGGFIPDSLTR